MDIIKMSPVFKSYIWGGENINKMYGKNTPKPPVAESWEVSAHKDGMSIADGGEYAGMTMPELCEKYGENFYGKGMNAGEDFPLLLKILDAEDNLSVQVHPDDNYAFINENGGKGKTEAWYILSAKEGARLIYGFKNDITKEDFKNAIENGSLEDILNYVECKEGDVFYIPAGTVHAVGKGLVIAEIQQSSNTTYRVYDYNRRDKEGKLRDLHIDKALDVSNFTSSKGKEKATGKTCYQGENRICQFVNNEFFAFEEISVVDEFVGMNEDLLHIIFIVDGNLMINGKLFNKGDSLLVPACVGKYTVCGNGKILRFYR